MNPEYIESRQNTNQMLSQMSVDMWQVPEPDEKVAGAAARLRAKEEHERVQAEQARLQEEAAQAAGHCLDSATATFCDTSMACLHVSGGVALVFDADPSKAFSKVFAELLDVATHGALSGLRTGDINSLLNVANLCV